MITLDFEGMYCWKGWTQGNNFGTDKMFRFTMMACIHCIIMNEDLISCTFYYLRISHWKKRTKREAKLLVHWPRLWLWNFDKPTEEIMDLCAVFLRWHSSYRSMDTIKGSMLHVFSVFKHSFLVLVGCDVCFRCKACDVMSKYKMIILCNC